MITCVGAPSPNSPVSGNFLRQENHNGGGRTLLEGVSRNPKEVIEPLHHDVVEVSERTWEDRYQVRFNFNGARTKVSSISET
jgi:hypothetical protein